MNLEEIVRSGESETVEFKEANEIEQYGSGIKRIVNSCLAYNLSHPKFEEIAEGVRVTVFKAAQKTTQKITLSEKIIGIIKDNPMITQKEIAEAITISPNTVKEYIAKLKREGKIKRIGPDKGGHWEVT